MIIVRSKTEVSTSAVGVWEKGGVGVGVWESFRSITQQNISCDVIMFLVSVLVMVFMYLWLGVFIVLCLYILCCGVCQCENCWRRYVTQPRADGSGTALSSSVC